MKIGKIEVGENSPPLIIAEIGINHGGSLDVARKMVFEAFKSGCEIIKHQTHIVEDEMTEEAKYIIPPNANISIWDIINECSLSLDDEIALKKYTESLGMEYISTPFSRKAADFLNEIGVPAFKVGSGESNNLALLKHIAQFGKPIILSTGMHSTDEIIKSVELIESFGLEYSLLQCTNLYPSPPDFVSLKGILELKEKFPKAIVGFSDHSIGPEISITAMGIGANIIERHFTDTKYRKGPDIICSMDPVELKYLIYKSREIFLALQKPKMRFETEKDVYLFARSSVVADVDIEAGCVITEKDIWARRPGTGEISGEYFYDVVGKRAVNKIKRNQQIRWSDLEEVGK